MIQYYVLTCGVFEEEAKFQIGVPQNTRLCYTIIHVLELDWKIVQITRSVIDKERTENVRIVKLPSRSFAIFC